MKTMMALLIAAAVSACTANQLGEGAYRSAQKWCQNTRDNCSGQN